MLGCSPTCGLPEGSGWGRSQVCTHFQRLLGSHGCKNGSSKWPPTLPFHTLSAGPLPPVALDMPRVGTGLCEGTTTEVDRAASTYLLILRPRPCAVHSPALLLYGSRPSHLVLPRLLNNFSLHLSTHSSRKSSMAGAASSSADGDRCVCLCPIHRPRIPQREGRDGSLSPPYPGVQGPSLGVHAPCCVPTPFQPVVHKLSAVEEEFILTPVPRYTLPLTQFRCM